MGTAEWWPRLLSGLRGCPGHPLLPADHSTAEGHPAAKHCVFLPQQACTKPSKECNTNVSKLTNFLSSSALTHSETAGTSFVFCTAQTGLTYKMKTGSAVTKTQRASPGGWHGTWSPRKGVVHTKDGRTQTIQAVPRANQDQPGCQTPRPTGIKPCLGSVPQQDASAFSLQTHPDLSTRNSSWTEPAFFKDYLAIPRSFAAEEKLFFFINEPGI